MAGRIKSWNSGEPSAWAGALGLVDVPLFGQGCQVGGGRHFLLRDGSRASFALFTDCDAAIEDDETLSWAWSANVRHSIYVGKDTRRVLLRRWDIPGSVRRFRLESSDGARELLDILEASRPARSPDVIARVMEAFWQIRSALNEPTESLNALNILLLAVREVAVGQLRETRLRECRTFGEVLRQLPEQLRLNTGISNLPEAVEDTSLDVLLSFFLDPAPHNRCRLRADLLFRHAASQLYQEAHFQLERTSQTSFTGMSPPPLHGRGPRDVRYTPTNLARALVDRVMDRIPPSSRGNRLVIMDPACGSGVFLQECLAAAVRRGRPERLELHGIDISGISKSIAESCLYLAKMDLGGAADVDWQIDNANALDKQWDQSDIILMNPPFRAWQDMDGDEQRRVGTCLGEMMRGRADLALAFLWKAFRSLKPGGLMAVVLPAALLDNESGKNLRQELARVGNILLIGKFEGFSYFSSSLVETAFVVLAKPSEPGGFRRDVELLVASEGSEDEALRVLRGASEFAGVTRRVELFGSSGESVGEF